MQIRSRILGCKVKHNFLFINSFSQLFYLLFLQYMHFLSPRCDFMAIGRSLCRLGVISLGNAVLHSVIALHPQQRQTHSGYGI